MHAPFDLVIFDLDGTLVDSVEDLAVAVNLMLADLAEPPRSLAEVCGFVGNGAVKLVERSLPGPVSADALNRAVDLFGRHYLEHLLDFTRPYPRVEELLDALDGQTTALATNKPERFARRIVEGLGWTHHFECLVGGDTFPYRKPDGRVITSICKRLEAEPAKTLMVGDSQPDVQAAIAAGAQFCGVSWGFRREDQLRDSGAARIVDSADGLLEVIGRGLGAV